jgi:purine-binding chemotaxis protein CheW
VGSEEFAVDIMHTREVVRWRDITPVPETQGFVEGVMNLRGKLVPVLDLRKRLRAKSFGEHPERRIIIATHGGNAIGLIVDGASDVVRADETMIEPPPDIVAELGVDYISGLVSFRNRFILMVDLEKVLDGEIASELDEVLAAMAKRLPEAASPPRTDMERAI